LAFGSDYARASRFLKFCFDAAMARYWTRGRISPLGSEYMLCSNFSDQFVKLLRKYYDYPKMFLGLSSSSGLEFTAFFNNVWVDSEFDWLICTLVSTKVLNGSPFPYSNPVFGGFFFINHAPSILKFWKQGDYVDLNFLGFDYSRKFSNNYSVFRSWQSRRGIYRGLSTFSINNRFMFSFQIHFNYSDFTALAFHISNLQHIHVFNPIFSDMYGLPFLLPSMRPNFNNPSIIHTYNRHNQLHYMAVYAMNREAAIIYIFDKYLYDHARLLLMLPSRYFLFPRIQYSINVASINSIGQYSANCYAVCRSFLVNYTTYSQSIYEKCINGLVIGPQYFESFKFRFGQLDLRKNLIVQIILNCWFIVSKLQKWFEFINYCFFYAALDSNSMSRLGYHDSDNTFVGLLDLLSFDRITRRVFFEFSRYLYSCPLLACIIFFWLSTGQVSYFNSVMSKYNFLGNEAQNMLTELEIGYRGLVAVQNTDREHFGVLDSPVFEQMYDYELWLYVYLTGWRTFGESFC
jgi:hypothetical protein